MRLSRRSFIRWVVAGGAALACPRPLRAAGRAAAAAAGKPASLLRGEALDVCHRLRDGEALPEPAPERTVDLAIVGAGPSGLAAAEHAQASDFLLLEKEDHVGGNAYAETWEGLRYCTGSAWASVFNPEVAALFKRWDFDLKPIRGLDAACFAGTWVPEFWDSNPDCAAIGLLPYPERVRGSFRKFLRDISKLDLERDEKKLDAVPFTGILRDYAPEVAAYWDCFGPSNWGCKAADTSALMGIGAARDWPKAQRYTWEGGLGVASERIFAKLSDAGKKRVVLGAAVYSVRRGAKLARVSWLEGGRPRAVDARAVVVATPKFITRRIVHGLPEGQRKAMAALRYAPYLVYNLCFDRVVYNQAYDNFVVGAKSFTDFIPADFVTHGKGGDLARKQVLTVYAPSAERERTAFLDDAAALSSARAAVDELHALFPGWGEHLREVRVFLRGHAMPMSTPGAYTRLQPLARRDFGNVFFAHSDSSADVSDVAYAGLNGVAAARKALALL